MSKQPSISLIAGPTASGKSALALKLARDTGAIILNGDSQQLYADLRVLTARPSVEEEALAEHRLYGVVDAAEAWSVGHWSRAILSELEQLDGQPALIVGGTGLYFTALTKGLADIPDVPIEVRDNVSDEFYALGEATFRATLRSVDPRAEARIASSDQQRLVRALSVYRASGRSLTEWQADTVPLIPEGSWQGIVVEPERDRLYANCDRRAELMIEQGALAEVEALIARGLDSALPAMKAVGLRELAAGIAGEVRMDEAIISLKQATRNYAKRQLTWFRNQTPNWKRA